MVIRTGIIGFSEGNGHPFSFSAIINGYDRDRFAEAGWPVILDYLQRQPAERFGIDGMRVTHAWTQDRRVTEKLCASCRIEYPCSHVDEMLGEVDALIIARDDWESHLELALPFLRKGIPVFVDKPLTLDASQLASLMPFLESGKLMSSSGLRYAAELEPLRVGDISLGSIRLISGAVLNGPEKYGIHLIEAVAGLGGAFSLPVEVTRLKADHDSFLLGYENGVPFHLDCLGNVGKTFHLSVFGDRAHCSFDLHDNFSAFRRTLHKFFEMLQSGAPVIEPLETVRIMKLLAAVRTISVGSTVRLDD